MTRQEARALVERELGESFAVLDDATIEKPWGWVFFYQSRRYLETGEHRDSLAGNAPYIVNRDTGDIRVTGTAKPIESYTAEYERSLEH